MTDSAQPLLPRLSDDELRSLFGHDDRAIWRYHILAAVLLEGRSATDVASQFETTTETVRSLRTSFLATGHLNALRSKRRGAAGHLTRQTPLAQAVARELAADPTASGGQIWRRVRDQLASSGEQVPRRSIYRLVERLRPQGNEADGGGDTLWAPALVPALRAALPLLPLDPPLDLGRSALAEQVLPENPDPGARGQELRQLLQGAIDAIGPGADDDPQGIEFRPAQVLIGEAVHGRSRDELQRELAIAPATYTRAKRQGLERLAELLVAEVRRTRQPLFRAVAPPPPPLLGRDRDLAALLRRVDDDGIAVLWGLPGSGKSALAANVAALYSARGSAVVWHVCSGTGDDILRAVLRSYGDEARAVGQDTAGLLSLLREYNRHGGLLVLEHYDRIADDPTADLLMATLRNNVDRELLRLLVVSRALPSWAERQTWLPLHGLAEEFARLLWTSVGGAALDPAAWIAIYHQTMGYPGLLHTRATQPEAAFVAALRALLVGDLSPSANAILNRLLLTSQPLHAPPGDAGAAPIAELARHGLVMQQVQSDSYALCALLQVHRGALAALIEQPASVQRQLAAEAIAEHDWLRAAEHYLVADAVLDAMQVIGAHLDEVVAQRRGSSAIDMLHQILPRLAPGPELARVKAFLGETYLAIGCFREATEALRTALDLSNNFRDQLGTLDIRRWQRLTAEAYAATGRWRTALAHAQASMGGTRTIVAEVPPRERIALTLLQQRIWRLVGDVEQARYWLAEAKMQAQVSDCPFSSALVAYADGVDAMHSGLTDRAHERLEDALRLLPSNEAHCERCAITALLARVLLRRNEAEAAAALVAAQLAPAQLLGISSGVVDLLLARVLIALHTGEHDAARLALAQLDGLLDSTNLLMGADAQLIDACVTLAEGATSVAAQQVLQVRVAAQELGIDEVQAKADLLLAYAAAWQGDSGSAALYAARAAQATSKAGLTRLHAAAQMYLAYDALQRREAADARAALDAAELCTDPWVAGQRGAYLAALDADDTVVPPAKASVVLI